MGGRGSGAATRRAADTGVTGRGEEDCGWDGSEEHRGEHYAYGRAGDGAGDFRGVRERVNAEGGEKGKNWSRRNPEKNGAGNIDPKQERAASSKTRVCLSRGVDEEKSTARNGCAT